MTIYYISLDGDNNNTGLSLATAKKSMFDSSSALGAYEIAVDGDTILFADGVYTADLIETSAGLGYINNQKAIFIDSVKPYGATLLGNTSSTVYQINTAALANKTCGFGANGINLSKPGAPVRQNYTILLTPTAGPVNIDLGNVNCADAIFYNVNITAANTIEIHVTGSPKMVSDRSGIDALTLGNNSSVVLDKPSSTCNKKLTGRAAFNLVATGAGVVVNILEPEVFINHDSSFGALQDYGIRIINVDNALVYKPTVNILSDSTLGTAYGVQIDCADAVLTAHKGRIIGGDFYLDCNGGITALIGHDSSNAFDNRANNGLIKGIKIRSGDKFLNAPVSGHGAMQGNITNGLTTGCFIDSAGYGILLKRTTTSRGISNKVRGAFNSFLHLKGCTDSSLDANEVFMDTGIGAGFIANADGAVNNTGCSGSGNIFHVNEGCVGKLLDIQTSQVVTLSQTIYNILEGASLPANPITYQGTVRASVEAHITASEASAVVISDRIITDYSLLAEEVPVKKVSPLRIPK
jgi:hypothetical protein